MTMKEIKSPCIHICTIDEEGLCYGCRRSEDEISEWTMLSDKERNIILEKLKSR